MNPWNTYCGVALESGGHCSRTHRTPRELIDHMEIDHSMSIAEARAYIDARRVRMALSRLAEGRDRMATWSFDTFPAEDISGRRALQAAREWMEGEAPRLYIWGPVGSGKTGLAYSIARDWIERYPSGADDVGFVNVRAWLAEGRARLSTGDQPEIDHLLDAGGDGSLVVLDDLGAERPTDWALEQIAYVVENRHAVDAWTIVTTNYAPSALAERLGRDDPVVGQRIVSRLLEDATKIELKRADLRVRNRAA